MKQNETIITSVVVDEHRHRFIAIKTVDTK